VTLRLGVDVGGTFTDVVVFDGDAVFRGKADTTHYDLKVGFFNAARVALEQAGLGFEDGLRNAASIVYSTTVGTNALLERRGTKLGLITTRGFEHTVMVGRSRNWADGLPPEVKYDRGRARRPVPLIPNERIVGIRERVDSLGQVIIPVLEDDVRAKVQQLVDQGVRGFVVVLLNSFVNPAHERRVRRIVTEQYPEAYLGHMPVYLSSDISPKAGEYRRSMTVILDAYLREITADHLVRLTDELRDMGYNRPVFVAKNTGGLSSLSRSQSIHLFGSSPAATVVGAEHLGQQIGAGNMIIGDMGGTSFDVGLVVEGRERVYDYDPIIDRARVQIPFVAHWSIGAGGGSIAGVVDGQLKVGPRSAGSNPGPACYGRGGSQPTVTDADVLLGYIDPRKFLGGKLPLDARRAEQAIREHVAEPLGISPTVAAWRIKALIDGVMGQEMYRICALMSGEDPRTFTALGLGGAGPVHATGFAEFADVRRVATLPLSSTFGAFSTLTYDVLQTYEKTVYLTAYKPDLAEPDPAQTIDGINQVVRELVAFGERDMLEEGFARGEVSLVAELHMSYGRQRQFLPIRLPALTLQPDDLSRLCDAFNAEYARRFGAGAVYAAAGIEIVMIRLNAVAPTEKFTFRPAPQASAGAKPIGSRRAFFGGGLEALDVAVYDRRTLPVGFAVPGPAFCDDVDTVVVVPPRWSFRTDRWNVGWIEKQG
jgi:N-methylhydantoinase A/oxoprolinase/acetone carboxylase beta subunit